MFLVTALIFTAAAVGSFVGAMGGLYIGGRMLVTMITKEFPRN